MWLPMRYILLRLSLNMNVCCGWSLVDARAVRRRIFGRPRSFLQCKDHFLDYICQSLLCCLCHVHLVV